MSATSPCINVCRMHPALGLCEGCARTLGEIGAWSQLGAAEKAHVLQLLPERQAALRAAGVVAVPNTRASW